MICFSKNTRDKESYSRSNHRSTGRVHFLLVMDVSERLLLRLKLVSWVWWFEPFCALNELQSSKIINMTKFICVFIFDRIQVSASALITRACHEAKKRH